jgi:hypothetical protein
MKRSLSLACLATIAALHFPEIALAQHAEYDALVATHARANAIPEVLVHRVIVRESRYQPALVGRGGTIGLMQIKLATARGLGYTGTAEGLRDPDTNLTYAVRYLAGAYRAANGDHKRAMHYYASGYYAIMPAGITPPPSTSGSNVSGIPNRCSPARRRKKLTKTPPTPTRRRFSKSDRRGRARPGHPRLGTRIRRGCRAQGRA